MALTTRRFTSSTRYRDGRSTLHHATMNGLQLALYISCLLTPCQLAVLSESEVTCRDHAGRAGSCGPVGQCAALFRLVDGRRPSPDEVRILRQSQCGRRQGRLLLCCAYSPSHPYPGAPERHPARPLLEEGSRCSGAVGNRITGGRQTALGQHQWLALIGYSHTNSTNVTYECSGALIGPRHVLTAAHCVTGLPAGLQLHSVRLGERDLSRDQDCEDLDPASCAPPPQDFPIAAFAIHEDYQKPFRLMNDLALVTLAEEARGTSSVSRACLPFGERGNVTIGVRLTVAGFGRVGAPDGPSSDIPLEVSLPVVDQEQCAEAIALLGGRIGPRQLCAGGELGRDVCFGDSGAPLVAPPTQTGVATPSTIVGIVTFGDRSCQGQVPGVFTRVSSYLNWILDRAST